MAGGFPGRATRASPFEHFHPPRSRLHRPAPPDPAPAAQAAAFPQPTQASGDPPAPLRGGATCSAPTCSSRASKRPGARGGAEARSGEGEACAGAQAQWPGDRTCVSKMAAAMDVDTPTGTNSGAGKKRFEVKKVGSRQRLPQGN